LNYDRSVTIILYTKVPEPGFVKTRVLHPDFSSEFQYLLHIAMLKDTLISLSKVRSLNDLQINFYPTDKRNKFLKLILSGLTEVDKKFLDSLELVPQEGKSHKERFSHAFKNAFQKFPNNPALIIGSDTPHLQYSLIEEVIKVLVEDTSNSVIGPSQNGGFYLLGYNPPFLPELKDIFENESSFGELGNALDILNTKSNLHIFPEVTDIDTFENLKSIRSILNLYRATSSVKNNYYFSRYTFELIQGLDSKIWENL
jgi:glycosyltransferase A (GT-A) superfamily protein (DUF2064 family)